MSATQIQQKVAYGDCFYYYLLKAQEIYQRCNKVPSTYELQRLASHFARQRKRQDTLPTF